MELWKQPFQACAIDADCVKPDRQNSVISFVICRALVFRPLVKRNEDSGNEIEDTMTVLKMISSPLAPLSMRSFTLHSF